MRDITLGDTFKFDFTTRAFATGIPGTLGGTPVLSVHEEGNDTFITDGVSIDLDIGSSAVTGLNEGAVVATSGNGYENGKSYSVFISTGTVGGVSVVGEVVHLFTVGASAAAVDLANGTDGLGALKTLIDALNDAPAVSAAAIVNEWESQSQSDPTGFHVNVQEWVGNAVTHGTGGPNVNANAISGNVSAATNLENFFGLAMFSGAAESGSTTTLVDQSLTSVGGDADYWKGNIIVFINGNIQRQARLITGFNEGTDTITFEPALTQAVVTQSFLIFPAALIGLLAATQTSIDAIETDTSDIQPNYATEAKQDTAQTDLDTISDGIILGTAVTGTLSITQCTSSLTGFTDDQMIGRIITFLAGPADGESSDITDYASASGLITFTAMTLASQNGNALKIT